MPTYTLSIKQKNTVMKRVKITSAEIVCSGYASKAAIEIAEEYAYLNIEDSIVYIDENDSPCDEDGDEIDLLADCDWQGLPESQWSTIGVEFTYELI